VLGDDDGFISVILDATHCSIQRPKDNVFRSLVYNGKTKDFTWNYEGNFYLLFSEHEYNKRQSLSNC
jgi:hypothetical protein